MGGLFFATSSVVGLVVGWCAYRPRSCRATGDPEPLVPADSVSGVGSTSSHRSFTPVVVARPGAGAPGGGLEGRIGPPPGVSNRGWGRKATTHPEASGESACLRVFRPLASCRARAPRDSELDRSTGVLSGPCPHILSGTPITTNGTPRKTKMGLPVWNEHTAARLPLPELIWSGFRTACGRLPSDSTEVYWSLGAVETMGSMVRRGTPAQRMRVAMTYASVSGLVYGMGQYCGLYAGRSGRAAASVHSVRSDGVHTHRDRCSTKPRRPDHYRVDSMS